MIIYIKERSPLRVSILRFAEISLGLQVSQNGHTDTSSSVFLKKCSVGTIKLNILGIKQGFWRKEYK
jgi:hypothetical protein